MENLPKGLGGVYLLHWMVTYPVDKVICSSNNWCQVVNKYIYIYIIPLSFLFFLGGGGWEVYCFGVVIEFFNLSFNGTNVKFTSRPLISILDKHEGEKVENTSPIVSFTFEVYCH